MNTRKIRRLKKSNKSFNKRKYKTSNKRKNRNTKRGHKRGGAAEDKIFNNLQELQAYLNKNQWISRVYIYNKDQFEEGKIKSIYRFQPNEFSKMFEIGEIKNYLFQFM